MTRLLFMIRHQLKLMLQNRVRHLCDDFRPAPSHIFLFLFCGWQSAEGSICS